MKLFCNKCALSKTCPKFGSSPLKTSDGKFLVCELIGNFGHKPVDKSILSITSKEKVKMFGEYTSYVNIPTEDHNSNKSYFQTHIVFHEKILHERQKNIADIMNRNYRRSFNQ